jgi:hypothetical protein
MSRGHRRKLLTLAALAVLAASGCGAETVEVTRIKIMERRVIEKVPVTVEVTRLYRVIETPRPTLAGIVPAGGSPTPQPSATVPTETASATPTRASIRATATAVPSRARLGQELMAALKDTEQVLLGLVQALNSSPLPVGPTIELYDTLAGVPTLDVPAEEPQLQSIYVRYREQVGFALDQDNDLYQHLAKIQSGEAAQTDVSPTYLGLARDAASTGTSTIQALIRELEDILNAPS